ncbi:hypothetical protein LTR64_000609 [Lithohypha guttulata]|uniref:uncharacterized protein n=1 Tax=Lithohypha guttulata TaxID=1690604 RepID=UPI002DDDCEB1|nr:hypothetical protein LTR51_005625 [Lithohypha guttulata]
MATGASAAASPAIRARADLSYSPLPTRNLKQMPSIQRMDASLTGSFMLASASTPSASSLNGSPSCSSYQSSPSLATQYQNSLSTVELFSLPDPLLSPSAATPTPNIYSSSFPRQNGLTRKISSGKRALSRLGRTTSAGVPGRREPSSGPVARRRSDSKTTTSATFDSDYPVPEIPAGLGISQGVGLSEEVGSPIDAYTRLDKRAEVVAPAVPDALVAGSLLTKMTKRKPEQKYFYLDKEGSTVSWMGHVKKKEFHIDNILTIRPGPYATSHTTDVQRQELDPTCFFTVSYAPSRTSKKTKTLQLLASSRYMCQLWVNTLEALSKHREEMMMEMIGSERESVLRMHWNSELAKQPNDAVSRLDLHAIAGLCRKLQIHPPRSVLEEAFHSADVNAKGLLDFEQFRAFIRRLRSRVDIKPLFNHLKSFGVEGISKEDFLNFVSSEQREDIDTNRNYWDTKFDELCAKPEIPVVDGYGYQYIDFASFASFLTSKECSVYTSPKKPRTSLDRPLNEYFINSSHNTYLTGSQYLGTSSVEPYVTALRHGCRSVEIDCWDGDNNNPRVTHGYTGTTSISFVEVIRAINRCAFEASPYPVILSLEVHCNPIQQARMVEIMYEHINNGKLLSYPLPENVYNLPSPEDLKYKILVKVKATNAHPSLESIGDSTVTARKRSASSPVRNSTTSSTAIDLTQTILGSAYDSPPPTDQSMPPTSEEEYESDANQVSRTSVEAPSRKTSKITQGLAALGVYMQGYTFRSPVDLTFRKFNHIYSIPEHKAIEVAKGTESKMLFEKHNVSHLCRIYPKQTRINSSNFDPNTFWRRGVQMVALNWQTYDIHMQMNQAMFAAGADRSGYVLKPKYLRDLSRFDGATDQKAKLPHYRIDFSIKVISAQQLPLLSNMGKNEQLSPFVEVQMFSAEDAARSIAYGCGGEEVSRTNGVHGIGKPLSIRTKTVPENGYNPQFNDLIELSLETKHPELVFVRFVVYQSGKGSNKELAVFTAKLDRLQQGYRHVPLYNSNGEELIFSSLFCHFKRQKPKPVTREWAPARHGSFRSFLSRSNTMDGGRQRGQVPADKERIAVQQRLNREIEAKKQRAL